MPSVSVLRAYTEALTAASDHVALAATLSAACLEMGCSYFALTHHLDFKASPSKGIRLHNYPDGWSAWFDARGLGVTDPIHRASHLTVRGFCWSDVPRMIALTAADRQVLDEAKLHGISDGFTVPANVPGEALGSCTFATATGKSIPEEWLDFAQWIGLFAFETARRIDNARPFERKPVLTERQCECVVLAGRGKTNWEISKIIDVSRDTASDHMRNARERYGTNSRVGVVARALYDGSISFSDIFRH